MSCNNNCNCNTSCTCKCSTTTTTTCCPTPPPACTDLCDETLLVDCIIYNGDDLPCYGIESGDNLKTILNIIFDKLNIDDCSCTFGSGIAQLIPTTTTTTIPVSTTSTSTTTTLPLSLCFNLVGNNEGNSPDYTCSTENKVITPGITINGKVSYLFSYDTINYLIRWSSTNNRWELLATSNPTIVIAYLVQNTLYPVGPLDSSETTNPVSLKWQWNAASQLDEVYVITRLSCPESLCLEVAEVESATTTYELISFYDSLDNYPTPPVTTKPYYISPCSETNIDFITIRWNSFTNTYELFIGTDKVAYFNESNIETSSYVNWIIYPAFSSDYESIKSKIGFCIV